MELSNLGRRRLNLLAGGPSRRAEPRDEIGHEALAIGTEMERLDMPAAGNYPEFFWLARGRKEPLAVLERDDCIAVTVYQEQRNRCVLAHRRDRAEGVGNGPRQRPLQRPGEPNAGELLARDVTMARKRAFRHHGTNVIPVPRVRGVVNGGGGTETLPEHDDRFRIDSRTGE